MTTVETDQMRGWPMSRQYRDGVANDICSICYNWDTSKPQFKCSECPNSFHRDCLEPEHRKYGSWSKCDELGDEYECHKGEVRRFKFGPPRNIDIKQEIQRLKKVYTNMYF